MNAAQLLQHQLQGLHDEIVTHTLKGLTSKQANWQPNPKANNLAFCLWHALRVWDWDHFRMGGGAELYEADGWPQRFGFETKGKGWKGLGFGTDFTIEDIAGMPMQPDVLAAYADALRARTQQYLATVSDSELAHEFEHQWRPGVMLTPAQVLSHTIAHTYLHVGEAQYVKGLQEA